MFATRTFRNAALVAILLAGTCLGMGAAHAQTAATNSQLLDGFNAITQNNLNMSSADSNGAVLVGGQLSASSTPIDDNGTYAPLAGYGAVNAGSLNGSVTSNGGTAYINAPSGGSFGGGNSHVVYGASAPANYPYSFSSVFNQLASLSSALSTVSATAGSGLMGSTITSGATTDGAAVMTISGTDLANLSNPAFNLSSLSAGQILIINVTGSGSLELPQNWNNFTLGSSILWNFYSASEITIDREFPGTVLAPNGNVTMANSSAIDGTVVAQNVTATGELHDHALNSTAYVNNFNGTVPVPEPASFVVLGSGLLGLGLLRRRRRA